MQTMRSGGALALMAAALILFAGCDSKDEQGGWAEQRRQACADSICPGDKVPAVGQDEFAFKLGNRWFAGPRAYGGNGASFHFTWPEQAQAGDSATSEDAAGAEEKLKIAIYLRSDNIPRHPRDHNFINLAESKGWIAERQILRPGLERIRMKHTTDPDWGRVDIVDYYVALDQKFANGQPAVAGCSHEHPQNQGGAGFLLKPDAWVGVVMNQRGCANWPEINQKVSEIINLVREI